jgi:hypothetical protein
LALAAGGSLLTSDSGRAAPVAARLTLDNDQFDFWMPPDQRPDFAYTHGTEIVLRFASAPRVLARLAPRALMGSPAGGPLALEIETRQSIYSPLGLPPERPFAGWLELAIGLVSESRAGRRELRLHAGVTGPPSGADRVQAYFHRHYDHIPALDWSNQLPFEPGLDLELATHSLGYARGRPAGWHIAAGPALRARAGIPATDLRLGFEATAGFAPPSPWGGRGGARATPRLYLRASPRLDLVLRDEFLAGTLLRASPRVDARALIPESEIGLGVGWSGFRLEWRIERRAREARVQSIPHTYGTLELAWDAPM